MPLVRFTRNIQRHVECPPRCVEGATVGEALAAYFDAIPRAAGYVLDERGALRHHMAVFVDGAQIRDRADLSDAVGNDSTVDVMQALSGG